jgi:hypothetical protein
LGLRLEIEAWTTLNKKGWVVVRKENTQAKKQPELKPGYMEEGVSNNMSHELGK